MKTSVYIDAFNLYFGALRGTSYRWLDVRRMCELLLPAHQIDAVHYFTARVNSRPNNPGQRGRQETYLRALNTLPNLQIVEGHFLSHPVWMPLARIQPGGPTMAEVIKTEEKGSDVNLATALLHDAHLNRFDAAVIISGDSDLLAPTRVVLHELNKPVGVLNPQTRPCRVLQREASFYKQIRSGVLAASQFAPTLTDARGTFHKPPAW